MATTISTATDIEALEQIHQGLADKSLLPSHHLVDTGYVSAETLVKSQQTYQVDLVGPARQDYKWQARAGEGFAAADFQLDWPAQQATASAVRLPPGAFVSILDSHPGERSAPCVHQILPQALWALCGSGEMYSYETSGYQAASRCPLSSFTSGSTARDGENWPLLYRQRAGIEGTLSQGVRGFGMRRSRYVGLPKTHLQTTIIATAINLYRLADWLNEVPLAKTRQAAFVKLTPKLVSLN